MDELFKKMVYSGIGMVSLGVDKLQTSLDKLVSENKISSEEGKKVVDEFTTNISAKRQEFEEKLSTLAEDVLRRMHLATTSRIEALEKRIAELEAKLGATAETDEDAKKTSKKKATAAEPA